MLVTVKESTISDVYRLAKGLRAEDAAEVAALGVASAAALRSNFRAAILRRSYFVDGELAAMSGLCGPMLSDIGQPYLLTTAVAERVPIAFVKHGRAAVADMLRHRLRLEGYVAASYCRACRFVEMAGFTLDPPRPLGSALFRKFWMVR